MEALISKIKPATATKSWNLDLIPKSPHKIFLVTGGTQGSIVPERVISDNRVGLGISLALLKHAQPTKLYILSDKEEHFNEALSLFKSEAPSSADKVVWKQTNFLNLHEVQRTSKALAESLPRLDCIWCNAGVGTGPQIMSTDNLDGHFTLNHLAHYVLLKNLLPLIRKTAGEHGEGRVVFTSSSLHTTAPSTIKFESREEINEDIGPNNLYARSKLANLLYARYLAKEVVGENVYINAIHPGAVKTEQNYQLGDPGAYGVLGKVMINTIRPFFKDAIEEGCLSALFAGTSPRIVEENIRGEYICPPDSIEESSKQAQDENLGSNLVKLSERLVGEILGKEAPV